MMNYLTVLNHQITIQVDYDFMKRYLVYGYKFLHKAPQTFFKGIREIDFASNTISSFILPDSLKEKIS